MIIRSALQNELDDLRQTVDKKVALMNDEQREEYYDFISDRFWELEEVIPNFSYASILIMIWSLLEHTTVLLAKRMGDIRGAKIRPNDLKDRGLRQAKAYLEKVLDIVAPNDAKWQGLIYLNQIRNFIIHNDGIIPKDAKYDSLRSYINETNGLSMTTMGKVQVNDSYCTKTIDLVEEYLLEQIDNCKEAGKSWFRPRN